MGQWPPSSACTRGGGITAIVAVLLGVCAAAFFSNYLALYLQCPACLGLLYGMTRMEERELVARFGEEYVKYQRRVSRFPPGCRLKRP